MLDSDNTTCLCVLHDRECDPDLCGACGADEHWTSGANPSCGNQAIQRRLRKHVSVGDSTVHGRGAFLREDVKEGEFIGEYVGGLISPDECDRRACVSEQAHLNYVFTLLEPQDSFSRQHLSSDVDAFRKGNKTKFINASETADQTNVFAAVRVVVGESRIGIYAARDIASGEELFIDYGEKYKGKSSGMHIDPPRQSLKPKSKKMKNETG
ncbi:hypothetical protein DFJ77DRAFT_507952 [Powellomyces hirtus]|nr:hypothetical protein DFJ77DRAFT_507952 [Powellomyces hirtus]